MNVMTWGAIATELAVGVSVWFPRLRPWVLAAGVLMHVMVDVHIQIGIFSYAMFVMYLAWIPPETVKDLPDKLKQLPRFRERGCERGLASAGVAREQRIHRQKRCLTMVADAQLGDLTLGV